MPQSKLPSLLLTTWLLGTIATKSRVGELLQTLTDYEIVYPKILTNDEGYRNRRFVHVARRERYDEDVDANAEEPLFIEVSNWTLRTTINDRLMLSSDFFVQWVRSDETRKDFNVGADCDLREGRIEQAGKDSLVVLTICKSEIYALLLVNSRSFFIQPLQNGQHVVYETKNSVWWSRKDGDNFVSIKQQSNAPETSLEHSFVASFTQSRQKNYKDAFATSNDGANPQWKASNKRQRRCFRESPFTTTRSWSTEPDLISTKTKRESTDFLGSEEFYNLTGDAFDLDLDSGMGGPTVGEDEKENSPDEKDEVLIEQLSHEGESEDIGYFSNPSWGRNKLPKKKVAPPRWLEIAIAADYSVIEFHGLRVQQYILALLNIVSAIYKDPSLDSNMILVIVRMILYAEKADSLVHNGNARRSLENVNKWNRKLLSLSDESHDVAVWLTRLDIGGPSGYAPVSGACNPARSCALNRDEGLTSAFIIAHEVAHILGLTHDGDKTAGNLCTEEASVGSVMAPMVAATFHRFYWSICSRKEFHRKAKQWSCLLNQPSNGNTTQLKAIMQETFTMDEQCRMEFGEGYELCKSFDIREPCSRLWCGNTNVSQICKTKKGPPMEGTLCGDNKWCINGYCELMERGRSNLEPLLYNARKGGWGAWSSWSKCSRTCGVGIQCRTRSCNNPRPAYGGKYCLGPSNDCKMCELPKCTTNVDLRTQQCSRLVNFLDFEELPQRVNVTWLPYEPEQSDLKCRLVCRSKETGEIYYSGKNLINGTPCSYGSTDICIQGECRRMGCDNVLGSTKIADLCGKCDGNNSDCDTVVNKFQRKLRRAMTRVAVVRRAGYNMSVNVTIMNMPVIYENNVTFIIKDGRRRRHKIIAFDSKGQEMLIVEGAAFRVQKLGKNMYTIKTSGAVMDNVIILLVAPLQVLRQKASIAASSRYWISRSEKNNDKRYRWSIGGWNFCSVTCGGGTRRRTIACKDEKTGRIVSRRKCTFVAKPVQEVESCNVNSCDYKWLPGVWENCTTKCGSTGIQIRQLYCVLRSFNGSEIVNSNDLDIYRAIVQPAMCDDNHRPISTRECNRVPCRSRSAVVANSNKH